jgi:hypothetical protein
MDGTVDARVPETCIALEALPSHHNLLELAELPRAVRERRAGNGARRIEVDELELKNHVELLVRGEDIPRELGRGVRKRCFADGYEVVFWCNGTLSEIEDKTRETHERGLFGSSPGCTRAHAACARSTAALDEEKNIPVRKEGAGVLVFVLGDSHRCVGQSVHLGYQVDHVHLCMSATPT